MSPAFRLRGIFIRRRPRRDSHVLDMSRERVLTRDRTSDLLQLEHGHLLRHEDCNCDQQDQQQRRVQHRGQAARGLAVDIP
jgi:hypothetical protein